MSKHALIYSLRRPTKSQPDRVIDRYEILESLDEALTNYDTVIAMPDIYCAAITRVVRSTEGWEGPPPVNHALELVKATQEVAKAKAEALKKEEHRKLLSRIVAFTPLRDIINPLLEHQSKHYRYHNQQKIPLREHISSQYSAANACHISFWDGGGNIGFSLDTMVTNEVDGEHVIFRHCTYSSQQPKTVSLEEAKHLLVEKLSQIMIIE